MPATRPVLRYHGGKWMLAPWILEHFPPHRVYTEAYGGAASLLIRKERARLVEVYNDLDGEIVSLFRVLRDPVTAGALREVLKNTPFARAEFSLSYQPTEDHIEQARRTVVRSFFGFGSDSASGATTGFRANGNRNNAHPARDFANYPDALEAFTERLQGVVIENRPAVEILLQHDTPETLHYCDPPYTHGSRSEYTVRTGKGYRHEMTDDDHRRLAEVLHDAQGIGEAGFGAERDYGCFGRIAGSHCGLLCMQVVRWSGAPGASTPWAPSSGEVRPRNYSAPPTGSPDEPASWPHAKEAA